MEAAGGGGLRGSWPVRPGPGVGEPPTARDGVQAGETLHGGAARGLADQVGAGASRGRPLPGVSSPELPRGCLWRGGGRMGTGPAWPGVGGTTSVPPIDHLIKVPTPACGGEEEKRFLLRSSNSSSRTLHAFCSLPPSHAGEGVMSLRNQKNEYFLNALISGYYGMGAKREESGFY